MAKYIIKSSIHDTRFSNKEKQDNLSIFVDECRSVMEQMINYIWNNDITWIDKEQQSHTLSIRNNHLDTPKYFDYNMFPIDTFLTARALSSLATQVAGMIKSAVEKQRKRLYMLEKKKAEGVSKAKLKHLIKNIKNNIPQIPNCKNANIELSSKCIDWQDTPNGEFIGFLKIKAITKDKMEIHVPIKGHKHSNRLSRKGTRMNSFLISKSNINVRWKINKPNEKTTGVIIGADQGMKDVLTCSDGCKTPHHDAHGHNLESIMTKLCRKKKGSKAFKKAQRHRTNYINWSINQLNFDNIKELRLEQVINIGYKNKTSRMMSHWTNTTIRDKIEAKCEEEGTRLVHQSSTYRSQRCSQCGIVRRANRKGKIYSCKHCGNEMDADLNASLNHTIDLPDIPYPLREMKINRGNGFYWLPSGFYDFTSSRSLESLLLVKE